MTNKQLKDVYQYSQSKNPRPPKIAVVGDLMLDEHVTCDVMGISPEDDLAWKLRTISHRYSLGGAANVAMNIRSLGGDVLIAGVVGCDVTGMQLTTMFDELDRITLKIPCEKDRNTTQKTRYMTRNGRHIARIDEEDEKIASLVTVEMLLDGIREFLPDFIVVSDYRKGTVTSELIQGIVQMGTLWAVDPKASFDFYHCPYIITPNEKEFMTEAGWPGSSVKEAIKKFDYDMHDPPPPPYILIKQSGDGAQLWERTSGMVNLYYKLVGQIPAHRRTHGDPAGCGDSLMAGLAYGLAMGLPVVDAVKLGVAAGSVAFDATGVRVVEPAQLIAELDRGEANG